MYAHLQLPFAHCISSLLHIASLELTRVTKLVTQCCVKAVAIKKVDISTTANTALTIYKYFVVECQVPRAIGQIGPVKGDVGK